MPSGIAPGRGTNRNERLHRELNTVLHSSQYGIELGYGLLTTIFYAHNENIAATSDKRAPRPIAAYTTATITCGEHFGLLNPSKGVASSKEDVHESPKRILPLVLSKSN